MASHTSDPKLSITGTFLENNRHGFCKLQNRIHEYLHAWLGVTITREAQEMGEFWNDRKHGKMTVYLNEWVLISIENIIM